MKAFFNYLMYNCFDPPLKQHKGKSKPQLGKLQSVVGRFRIRVFFRLFDHW